MECAMFNEPSAMGLRLINIVVGFLLFCQAYLQRMTKKYWWQMSCVCETWDLGWDFGVMGWEMLLCYNDYKALECGSRNYFQQNEDFLLTYVKVSYSFFFIEGELVTISPYGLPDSWPKSQSLIFHILACRFDWLSPHMVKLARLANFLMLTASNGK